MATRFDGDCLRDTRGRTMRPWFIHALQRVWRSAAPSCTHAISMNRDLHEDPRLFHCHQKSGCKEPCRPTQSRADQVILNQQKPLAVGAKLGGMDSRCPGVGPSLEWHKKCAVLRLYVLWQIHRPASRVRHIHCTRPLSWRLRHAHGADHWRVFQGVRASDKYIWELMWKIPQIKNAALLSKTCVRSVCLFLPR
jgi:hypothetical protein